LAVIEFGELGLDEEALVLDHADADGAHVFGLDGLAIGDRVCKFGAVVGVTGTQKSACFREYQIRNNHGACRHIEAPETASMAKFVDDLAMAIGVSRHTGQSEKVNIITRSVNERQCLIVDNVQRLYKPKAHGDQPVFNFLQKLQDDTGCTIILSYTPDFTAVLEQGADSGYFEQFIGRMGGLRTAVRLPDFAPREDILMIAQSFGLKEASKHATYLEKVSRERGRIRILFEALQDARQFAQEDSKDLTIDYVKLARGED
jgi:AAA domain